MAKKENTQNQFSNSLKVLQIGKLLRKANITKFCGLSAYEVFQFLLLLVFQGKNLFCFLKCQKGFTLLTLGWSDGYSFIPIGFNMLSSASKSNRYNEVSDKIDHRTNGYKFRKESMMHKTDAAMLLIKRVLQAGTHAD